MNILNFIPFFNENDLKAIAFKAYKSSLARTKAPQSNLNVLMHHIGEIGELSQCLRKGKGERENNLAYEIIQTYDYFSEMPDDQENQFIIDYKNKVSGTVGDELADCFLTVLVLMERINKESEVNYFYHNHYSSVDNALIDFDGACFWAMSWAYHNAIPISKDLDNIIQHGHSVMHRLMTMANNIQYIALFLKIDLSLFVYAKMSYNRLRKD